MRHVALLLRDLPVGGVERVTLNLAAGLRAEGARVTLVVFSRTGGFADAVPVGVDVVELGGPANLRGAPWRSPGVLWRFARWLQEARPDAVIASKEQANLVAVVGRRVARVHTLVALTRHVPTGPGARALYRSVHGGADLIVAVSSDLAEALREQAPGLRRRIHHLPTAVLEPGWEARAAARPIHPWLGSGGVIVCVGRLDRQKGQDVLLRAMTHVGRGMTHVGRGVTHVGRARLLLVGDGPDRGALRRLVAELDLTDRVAFVGAVPDALPWIAAADILALPSRWEGLPTVLVEALACGTPVVAADCPTGPRELLAGAPSALVPVDDASALGHALSDALTDPRPVPFEPAPFTTGAAARAWLDLLKQAARPPRRGDA